MPFAQKRHQPENSLRHAPDHSQDGVTGQIGQVVVVVKRQRVAGVPGEQTSRVDGSEGWEEKIRDFEPRGQRIAGDDDQLDVARFVQQAVDKLEEGGGGGEREGQRIKDDGASPVPALEDVNELLRGIHIQVQCFGDRPDDVIQSELWPATHDGDAGVDDVCVADVPAVV